MRGCRETGALFTPKSLYKGTGVTRYTARSSHSINPGAQVAGERVLSNAPTLHATSMVVAGVYGACSIALINSVSKELGKSLARA